MMLLWCVAVVFLPGLHAQVHASSQSGVQSDHQLEPRDQRKNASGVFHSKLISSLGDIPSRSVGWKQADGSDRHRKGRLAVRSSETRTRSQERLFPSQHESVRHPANSNVQAESPLTRGSSVHSHYSTHPEFPEFMPSIYFTAQKRRLAWLSHSADSDDVTDIDDSAGSYDVTGLESPATTWRPTLQQDSLIVNERKHAPLSMTLMSGSQYVTQKHVLAAGSKPNPGSQLGSGGQQDTRARRESNVPSDDLSSFADGKRAVPAPEEQMRGVHSQVDDSSQLENATYDVSQMTADDSLQLDKRSSRCNDPEVFHGDLPWTCRQTWRWRHLGEQRYPSRIYEAVCEETPCYYGHYRCAPVTYTLKILQVCPNLCEDDERVPYPLRTVPRMRTRWQYTDVNVTVGCMCTR